MEVGDKREDVQKKTFTKWINSQLAKRSQPLIDDLFVDLRDGTKLIYLLEILCKCEIKGEKGHFKVHHLQNVVRQALQVPDLNKDQSVNRNPNNIVQSNPKLMLSLVWSVIMHWYVDRLMKVVAKYMQHRDLEKTLDKTLEKTLLLWCRNHTKGYEGVDITNFTTCWSDGLAFNALLHRFRPHFIDYKAILEKDPKTRLNHAINLAFKHLNIDKLLDLEDMNTSLLDKKSVMVYVLCFFEALQNNGIGLSLVSTSDRSEASSSDLDRKRITEYLSNLKDILTWMSGTEEELKQYESIVNKDLETVKQLFNDNELFMIELSHFQHKISDMFNEGQNLIISNVCHSNEISLEMNQLRQNWDRLRFKAMDRQQELSDALMSVQQKQLDRLKEWLTSVEVIICDLSNIGPTLAAVKEQIKQYKLLQKEVEQQQKVVNSVSNMVVINDDNSDNDFSVLEYQLETLAERWRHVCRSVEETGDTLETIYKSWKILSEEEKKFSNWLTKLDRRLTEMEEAAAETKLGSKFVLNLVERLQKMENEMELQQTNSSNLADHAQIILGKLDRGSDAALEITRNLERLIHHWDSMLQRMEQLGETLNALSQPGSRSSISSQSSSPEEKEISSSELSSSVSKSVTGSSAEKRRLDSWHIQEWHRALDTLSSWMERIEEAFGIADDEEGSLLWDSLAIEEQQVLLEDTEADIEMRKTEFEQLISQGKQIVEDLSSIGEDSHTIEEVVQTLLDRWMEVNNVMDERHKRVNSKLEINRIHNETDAMSRILETHNKWLLSAEESINNSEDLPKLIDQSKLRLKSMQSQKEKVQKINEDILKLCAETLSMTSDSSVNDIKSFVSYWEETNKKIISIDNRLKDQSLRIRSETVSTLTQRVTTHDKPDDEERPPELVNTIEGLSDCLNTIKIFIESDFIKSISDSNALEKKLKK